MEKTQAIRRFTRKGQSYTAEYNEDGRLVRLTNKTTGQNIPSDTQSFRRLADENRGKKFQPV